MTTLRALLSRLSAERLSWFGAGLSAAALGVVGYQFVVAAFVSGALPGLQPTPVGAPAPAPSPTASRTPRDTATPRPTATPWPSATPRPTRTPTLRPPPPPTGTPRPTSTPLETSTPRPTATPWPTATPRPTATPTAGSVSAELLATLTAQDPAGLAAAVATFVSQTADVLQSLPTPRPR